MRYKNDFALSKCFFVLLFSVKSAWCETEIPKSMAAIGDSITAGALAAFNRTDAHNPLMLPKFLYFLGKMGYLRSLKAMESRGHSWATGLGGKVDSHAQRLQDMADDSGFKIKILNAAISGSTSANIRSQVDEILKWSNANLKTKAPDYVLLDMGANDACGNSNAEMTKVGDYGDRVHAALVRLLKANPRTKVMIGGIPDVAHLRKVAENALLGIVPPLAKCKDMWKVHKFCQNMLLEENSDKRDEISRRISSYMHELEVITAEINQDYGSDHVRFAPAVHDYNFTSKQISIDCFHPNKKGQQAIADLTWDASWWAHN